MLLFLADWLSGIITDSGDADHSNSNAPPPGSTSGPDARARVREALLEIKTAEQGFYREALGVVLAELEALPQDEASEGGSTAESDSGALHAQVQDQL